MPSSPYLNKPLRTLAEAAAAVEKARAEALKHCKPEAGDPRQEKRFALAQNNNTLKRRFHPTRKAS